jgi:hypothetical protein
MSSISVHRSLTHRALVETGEVDANTPVMQPIEVTFTEGVEKGALRISQGEDDIRMDAEAAEAFFLALREMMGKN